MSKYKSLMTLHHFFLYFFLFAGMSSFIHEFKQRAVRFQHRNIVQKSVWLQIFLLPLLHKKFTIHMKDVQATQHIHTKVQI